MIRFSVLIPTRDRPEFLAQALDSVLDQLHADMEIMVIDDGEGAAATAASISSHIRVLDNSRRGPVAARNAGVAAATGDVVAFLDDDDRISDNHYLSRMAGHFAAGADFCFADGVLVFDDGRPDLAYSFEADAKTLSRDNTMLVSAVSYRRSLHDRLGGFDPDLPYYWDWDWYLRVARSGARLVHDANPAVVIRVHGTNMSNDTLAAERRANLDRLEKKHGLAPLTLKNHVGLALEKRS